MLLAVPLLRRAHRVSVAERLRPPRPRMQHGAGGSRFAAVRATARRAFEVSGPVARVGRALVLPHRHRAATRALERELPVALDLLGVAVAAGCTPYLAVEVAASWAPPVVAASLGSVLTKCSLGASFDTA